MIQNTSCKTYDGTDLRRDRLYVMFRLRLGWVRAEHATLGDGAVLGIHGITSRTTEAIEILWEKDRQLMLAAVRRALCSSAQHLSSVQPEGYL